MTDLPIMKRILAIILTMTFLSCNYLDNSTSINKKDTFPVKELIVNKSEDQGMGADIRLSFTESIPTNKGIVYKVTSTYKNKMIGFDITVPNTGLSKLIINGVGINSDNFIQAISKLYKQKIDTSLHFVNSITVDCINMGDFIDSLNKQANSNYYSTKSQYKLFFQGKSEDDYAELYLNVNMTEHWIELEEKDEQYRPFLIKFLTHE